MFKKCLHWKESKKGRKQERICRRIPEKTKDDFEEFFFLKKFLRKSQFWKETRSKIGCLRRLRLCRVFLKNLVLEGRKH